MTLIVPFLVFSRARHSLPSLLLFPGNTRLFIRFNVTDQHHPAIEQHHRIVRTTAQDYDLPLPPTLPPEEIRQRLDKLKTNSRQPQDKHAAMPLGSADAI